MIKNISSNADFYDKLISSQTDYWAMSGWSSQVSQSSKFTAIASHITGAGNSILDIGCGVGCLYGYLSSVYPGIKYYGIDHSSKAIDTARKRYPETSFSRNELHDFSIKTDKKYEYVVACGLISSYDTLTLEELSNMIDLMANLCASRLIFNCLLPPLNTNSVQCYGADVGMISTILDQKKRKHIIARNYWYSDATYIVEIS